MPPRVGRHVRPRDPRLRTRTDTASYDARVLWRGHATRSACGDRAARPGATSARPRGPRGRRRRTRARPGWARPRAPGRPRRSRRAAACRPLRARLPGGERHQHPAHQRQQHPEQRCRRAASAWGSGTPPHSGVDAPSKPEVGAPKSAPSHTKPASAVRISSHWRTRTRPAQAGIRSAPRSVAATARSSRSPRSGSRETDARADGGRPGGGHALGDLVGQRADLGVDAGPLHAGRLRHRRAGGAGELLAGRAEVEVQPLERVGLEPGEPGDDRPAGGAVGAQPGGLVHRLDHGRHAGRVGEGVVEGGHALLGQRPGARRCRWPPARAGRRCAVGLEPRAGDLLLRHALGDDGRPELVDAPAVAGADAAAPGRRRGRRPRAGGVRRRACPRGGPRGRCRCG